MGGRDTPRRLLDDRKDLSPSRALLLDPDVERAADYELHGDPHLPLVGAQVEDRNDVGVRQLGERLGLAVQPGARDEVIVGAEQLDSDLAVELWIVGQVDDAHAARAERAQELEPADVALDGRGGGRRGDVVCNRERLVLGADRGLAVRTHTRGDGVFERDRWLGTIGRYHRLDQRGVRPGAAWTAPVALARRAGDRTGLGGGNRVGEGRPRRGYAPTGVGRTWARRPPGDGFGLRFHARSSCHETPSARVSVGSRGFIRAGDRAARRDQNARLDRHELGATTTRMADSWSRRSRSVPCTSKRGRRDGCRKRACVQG